MHDKINLQRTILSDRFRSHLALSLWAHCKSKHCDRDGCGMAGKAVLLISWGLGGQERDSSRSHPSELMLFSEALPPQGSPTSQ